MCWKQSLARVEDYQTGCLQLSLCRIIFCHSLQFRLIMSVVTRQWEYHVTGVKCKALLIRQYLGVGSSGEINAKDVKRANKHKKRSNSVLLIAEWCLITPASFGFLINIRLHSMQFHVTIIYKFKIASYYVVSFDSDIANMATCSSKWLWHCSLQLGKPEAFPPIPTEMARRLSWTRNSSVCDQTVVLTAWGCAGTNSLHLKACHKYSLWHM